MSNNSYQDEELIKNNNKLKKELENLANFVSIYIRGISTTTQIRTRLAYTRDIRIFLNYLCNDSDLFHNYEVKELEINDLELVTVDILDQYMEYLTVYETLDDNGVLRVYKNSDASKARKLAAVRSMFKFFYRRGNLNANPGELVLQPRIRDKKIVRLEIDEVASLLDLIENGEKLSANEKIMHRKTKSRDLAITTLLLGTGIRVSELVGIDIDDFDFSINAVKIIRKGGDEDLVYFSNEVAKSLVEYLEDRQAIKAIKNHETACFLSMQRSRMTVRAVQNMVKKYSKKVTSLKNISPHKLRSTYATNLYRETEDIYLVADVLGHADVNTTKKHYAHLDDEQRRIAARKVRLRDN